MDDRGPHIANAALDDPPQSQYSTKTLIYHKTTFFYG